MSQVDLLMLYADRKPWELEPHYSAHVAAMTEEGLHEKAAIAAELAHRDMVIEQKQREISRLRVEVELRNKWNAELREEVTSLEEIAEEYHSVRGY